MVLLGRSGARATAMVCLLLTLAAPCLGARSSGAAIEEVPMDLTEVSLDELTRIKVIKVTSVSKKQQDLTRTAAAVYVVTAEEVRRSGATSLPEALRLVPGIYVARIDGSKWSVTSRGFGGRFASKLLVLIDGRTLYSPMFGGVFWEMYDVVMEDIDRIEVIRGPAATMWGANAVNGVINVVTKSAAQTQGSLISTTAGSRDGLLTALRHGGEAVGGHYRVYAKYQDRASSPDIEPGSIPAEDDWASMRAGFRFEKMLSQSDSLELHGEMNQMDGSHRRVEASLATGDTLVTPSIVDGTSGYMLARWRRSLSETSELSVQAYLDHLDRREEGSFDVEQNTSSIEVQHRWDHAGGGELNWGVDFRTVGIDISPAHALRIPEEHPRANYSSVFAEEEWTTLDNTLILTAGLKLEDNSLGGFSPAPSARALWAPHDRFSAWASASRAPRAPSFAETSTEFDIHATSFLGQPALVSLMQSEGLNNEILTAYEFGFRVAPRRKLNFDVSVFRNRYDEAFALTPGAPELEQRDGLRFLRVPLTFENGSAICTRGVEVAAKYSATSWWRLFGTYSHMSVATHADRSHAFVTSLSHLQSPRHMAGARSSWNLPGGIELDVSAAYVDNVVAAGYIQRGELVDDFVRADARFQWKLSERTRLSFGVQNMFDPNRFEYDPESFSVAAPVGRNVYGGVLWSF